MGNYTFKEQLSWLLMLIISKDDDDDNQKPKQQQQEFRKVVPEFIICFHLH